MGSSKSSKVIKTFSPKKKAKNEQEKAVTPEEAEPKNEKTSDSSAESFTTDVSFTSDAPATGPKTAKSKSKKKPKKKEASAQKVLFPNASISNLSRGLGPNDWIRLAYALGFLPQGIAHFTGRASSAQNSYSQCSLMLKTWREMTPSDEILPRLCDALRRIRRHDLAVKMGLELGTCALPQDDDESKSKLLLQLKKSPDEELPPFEQSKVIFTDNNVSFLARHLLAREEWKRLAYALGFYPDDASQIIASASSCQNLYAQAHLMLLKWREQTPSSKIIPSLKAAFTRIRRHDLVFLLDLGVIAGTEEVQASSLEKLCQIYEKVKKSNMEGLGRSELAKFKDLLSL